MLYARRRHVDCSVPNIRCRPRGPVPRAKLSRPARAPHTSLASPKPCARPFQLLLWRVRWPDNPPHALSPFHRAFSPFGPSFASRLGSAQGPRRSLHSNICCGVGGSPVPGSHAQRGRRSKGRLHSFMTLTHRQRNLPRFCPISIASSSACAMSSISDPL